MPPNSAPTPITSRQVASCLAAEYGLILKRLTVLPLSHAGETWVYRAETSRETCFLKLKKTLHQPGVAVCERLLAHGLPVVAPIPSRSGHSWVLLDGFYLLLFPFVPGHPIHPATLAREDWRLLGSILRDVHNAALPDPLRQSLEHESFTPPDEACLSRIESAWTRESRLDPVQEDLRTLWNRHQRLLSTFVRFVQQKGQRARQSNPVYSLCHGDFQPGNILQSAPDRLLLVDWDNPVWSPRERDLMFIAPEYLSRFETGYGPIARNESVAEYLAANWLLQEVLDYAQRILVRAFTGELENEPEKRWALAAIASLLSKMRTMLLDAS